MITTAILVREDGTLGIISTNGSVVSTRDYRTIDKLAAQTYLDGEGAQAGFNTAVASAEKSGWTLVHNGEPTNDYRFS